MADPTGEDTLKVALELVSGGRVLRMSGVVDTNFPRATLFEFSTDEVLLDLDGVSRITSYGVRQWVQAIKDLPARYFGFVRCRPALVAQFNTMAHFAGRGELLSLYLPYLCGECDTYVDVLLDISRERKVIETMQAPEVRCSQCGAQAEVDDVLKSYLAYAAKAPVPRPPASIQPVLDNVHGVATR